MGSSLPAERIIKGTTAKTAGDDVDPHTHEKKNTWLFSAPLLITDYNSINGKMANGTNQTTRETESSPEGTVRANSRGCGPRINIEPAMFLFMCSAMIKFPVFQSLLYEKACLNSHRYNASTCADIRAVHRDVELQREANHLLLASSLCLLGPSIPMALLLGALFDSWSTRKALLIPIFGVLLADLNYMLQCLFMEWSVYWLLLSDLLFGFAGGFTSIIGLFFAYSVKVTSTKFRSVRVATMEGTLGLGVMSGLLLSGQLRQTFGYSWVFIGVTGLHLLILLFVLLFVREIPSPSDDEQKKRNSLLPNEDGTSPEPQNEESAELRQNAWWRTVLVLLQKRLRNIMRVYRAQRPAATQRCLNSVLLALGVNLFAAAGLLDIMFSFLRFQLQWTDREYGWFSGLNNGLNSFSVLLLYPLLHKRARLTDLQLALGGILSKLGHILMLAFASSTLMAMLALIPALLSRFPTTGMRAMASACVRQHEQGKVFALISLLDGIASLFAALFFNGLYPYTLCFFAGTMPLLIALLLLIPVSLLIFIHLGALDKRIQQSNIHNDDVY